MYWEVERRLWLESGIVNKREQLNEQETTRARNRIRKSNFPLVSVDKSKVHLISSKTKMDGQFFVLVSLLLLAHLFSFAHCNVQTLNRETMPTAESNLIANKHSLNSLRQVANNNKVSFVLLLELFVVDI